jgi:hypothetical protein
VDAFHQAALAAGGKDHGAPGLRPQYHANYYGAFVLDPDGRWLKADGVQSSGFRVEPETQNSELETAATLTSRRKP